MSLRTFSYGGGVQSTACLVLAAQKKIDFPVFLFANVGDDSESLGTLKYVKEFSMPYAAGNGIDLHILHAKETLLGRIYRRPKSLPIPIRMGSGAPGQRTCTLDFKIKVIARWQKQNGATKENPAVCGIGFSVDEMARATTDSRIKHQVLEYPLLDNILTRDNCIGIIRRAGLPVPPKSACWFCPFKSIAEWARMRREDPAMFERACKLEAEMIERFAKLGKGLGGYFTRLMVPLDRAIPRDSTDEMVFPEEMCKTSCCMT